MPNFKPTTKIDVIGNLDLSPEKATGFFAESKQQNKFHIKPPNWDSAGHNIDLLAVQNDREHQAMLKLQKEMLENAKFQSELNGNRVKEVYELQAKLKASFDEVNTFMKECEEKKRIASEKVAKIQQNHDEIRQSIEKYKSDTELLTEFRDIISAINTEMEPYERVIEGVIAKTDLWSSVKDCMDRCDALMLGQTEMAQMEKQKIEQIEKNRAEMVRVNNEASLILLGFVNELTQMERDYENARAECLKWEKMLAKVRNCIAENNLTQKRMFDGIQLMYNGLCKRRGITPNFKQKDVVRQLDFIKNEIEVLRRVVQECKMQSNEEAQFCSVEK